MADVTVYSDFEAPKDQVCHCLHFFPVYLPRSGKASVYNAGDLGLSPGLGRSPGEGNGNPLQYSCLGNPMDSGTWQATINGVAKESYTT